MKYEYPKFGTVRQFLMCRLYVGLSVGNPALQRTQHGDHPV